MTAIGQEELPTGVTPQAVTIAGHSAQVVLSDDVLFLALFETGWAVVAAGGTRPTDPDSSLPYDCVVSGG